MNKIKKIIIINIIITIFIIITGFIPISYGVDTSITLTYDRNEIWAPFREAVFPHEWTFCRNHKKHTTKYAPIKYELARTKNMSNSTRKLLENIDIDEKSTLVQSIVWYLNPSRRDDLGKDYNYNALAEENSTYTAKYYSEKYIKDLLKQEKYKTDKDSKEYEVSVSDAKIQPKLSKRDIYDGDGNVILEKDGKVRSKDFYVIKVYKKVSGYEGDISVTVYPSKDGKKSGTSSLYQCTPNSEIASNIAQHVGYSRKITDVDNWMTILIDYDQVKSKIDTNVMDGFYIEISATGKNINTKGSLYYYNPETVTIDKITHSEGKYLKDAQKLLRYDFQTKKITSKDHTIVEISNDSEKSIKYIKSIQDEKGNPIASVGNGLEAPKMNYTKGADLDTAEIYYKPEINTTVMDGYTITYGIRYYSTGTGERELSESFDDTYSPGLEYVSISNDTKDAEVTTKDGKPLISEDEKGNKTITVEASGKTLNGYGANKPKEGTDIDNGFEYYDVFLTFKVNLSKAKNPDTIKQFKNNDVTVNRGYEITGKVFIDENLITDGKITKPRDNLLGNEDTLVSGIKVELIDDQGRTVQPIKDSTTGISYPTTVYTDDNGVYKFTHLPVGGEYYVKFTYNGQEYENVKYGVGGNENSSYAKEKWTDRKNFNSKFTEIYGKNYEKYNNENSERYSLKNTSEEESPQKQPQVTGATNKLNVSQAEFGIYAYSENIDSSTAYKNYLNLGIFKRHFDLSLENKLESMEISINGVTQKIDSINGGIIDGTILKDDLYIKESDYNYEDEDDRNKELAVYLNYKLTINNESLENFTGIIKSINFWYDSRLELEDQYNSDRNIHKFSEEVGDENSKFKKCEIQLKNSNVIPKENKTVDIRLKLSRETIKNCIENPDDVLKTFETVAEISCYGSEYYGDFGNGQSGNAGKIDDDSNSGNLDIQKYVSEIRKSTDPNTVLKFFNEDDAMRSLGIRLQVDDTVRTLSGKVFEDKTTNNENKRLGDGRYTENEDRKISRVKVELLEIKEPNSNGDTTSKVLLFNGDEFETQDSATTDDKGEYSIEGYIPSANYVIRFTYGDGSTGIYNAQDYKSTIDATGENYESINTTEQLPNGEEHYWYTHQNIENKSVAKDDDTIMQESKLENMNAIQLESYEKISPGDPRFYNTATTAKFCAPINWAGNNISNSKDEKYKYGIQNMNLGLAERPRSELKINKTVDHITLTTSDGRTLIDGKQGSINSTSWTERYVQAIVDENLIYGSTLKITYKYEVENTGELDYISSGYAYKLDGTLITDNNSRKYYDYGEVGEGQKIVTTKADKVIDYVDNKLLYDRNMQSNPENAEDTNEKNWNVATEEEINMLGDDAQNEANSINTKLITTKLNKELNPGDTTVSIYLTVSKVLSSEDDKDKNELVYNNYVEIIQSTNTSGRRSYSIKEDKLLSDVTGERGAPIKSEEDLNKKGDYILSIPGDLNPKTLITLDYEPDSDKAQEVQIVPPFGSQRIIWTIIATISAIILAGGIYLINRKVLKARNKK